MQHLTWSGFGCYANTSHPHRRPLAGTLSACSAAGHQLSTTRNAALSQAASCSFWGVLGMGQVENSATLFFKGG